MLFAYRHFIFASFQPSFLPLLLCHLMMSLSFEPDDVPIGTFYNNFLPTRKKYKLPDGKHNGMDSRSNHAAYLENAY